MTLDLTWFEIIYQSFIRMISAIALRRFVLFCFVIITDTYSNDVDYVGWAQCLLAKYTMEFERRIYIHILVWASIYEQSRRMILFSHSDAHIRILNFRFMCHWIERCLFIHIYVLIMLWVVSSATCFTIII